MNYIRDYKEYEQNHRFIMMYGSSIIAGGFWLGNMDVLRTFTKEYKKHVELLIGEGLANCDEQVYLLLRLCSQTKTIFYSGRALEY